MCQAWCEPCCSGWLIPRSPFVEPTVRWWGKESKAQLLTPGVCTVSGKSRACEHGILFSSLPPPRVVNAVDTPTALRRKQRLREARSVPGLQLTQHMMVPVRLHGLSMPMCNWQGLCDVGDRGCGAQRRIPDPARAVQGCLRGDDGRAASWGMWRHWPGKLREACPGHMCRVPVPGQPSLQATLPVPPSSECWGHPLLHCHLVSGSDSFSM